MHKQQWIANHIDLELNDRARRDQLQRRHDAVLDLLFWMEAAVRDMGKGRAPGTDGDRDSVTLLEGWPELGRFVTERGLAQFDPPLTDEAFEKAHQAAVASNSNTDYFDYGFMTQLPARRYRQFVTIAANFIRANHADFVDHPVARHIINADKPSG